MRKLLKAIGGCSFAGNRLVILLRAQMLGAISGLFERIAGMLVAGNILGVDALSAIAAVVPVTFGAQFVAQLVYCGSGLRFAKYQGEFDQERARKAVGLSLEMGVVVGVLIYVAMYFGRDLYLDAMGITGAVRTEAISYWRVAAFSCAWIPFSKTVWRLVYADGEPVTTVVADLLQPPLVVAFSVIVTKMTGTAGGSALGAFIAVFICDLIMSGHLLRKTSAVVPKWNFSWRGVWETISYSLTDALNKLCQCGLMSVVNKIVVVGASVTLLPVVSMLVLVQELNDLLDRIGDAYMPLAKMYIGEGNLSRAREIASLSFVVACVAGVLVFGLAFAFAPGIVSVYGIPPGPVHDHAVLALRICSMVLPVGSALSFLCSHYLVIDRIGLSVVETILEGFVLSGLCAAGFFLAWGVDALWIGVPVGALVTMVVFWLYQRLAGGGGNLLLLGKDHQNVLNMSFFPDAAKAVEASEQLGEFLRARGQSESVVVKAMLLVEEIAMTVVDGGEANSRKTLVEISLTVRPQDTLLVMRDTGSQRDRTDSDAKVSGLRDFVIAGLVQSCENRHYLTTIGCNRAAFVLACPVVQH